ncbi:protein argonaute-2-like [Centruroides sculpturatus]|uniref:protein argonaute-2-like n=1 Tax=Centruroides sculpturatus TaxID=218467 RepID=UPI000C6E8D3E|nr:protein argonaute-2-like [Centruroides sculpturatus]XP_023230342.1 protein argonaute-2-like [Centruroides sculpturatus]
MSKKFGVSHNCNSLHKLCVNSRTKNESSNSNTDQTSISRNVHSRTSGKDSVNTPKESCNATTSFTDIPCQAFGTSGINKSIFPRRPDFGKEGRPIQVKVNYFPLSLPSGNVYHYDVKITILNDKNKETMKAPNKQTCRKIINKLSENSKDFSACIPAYDGKANIITRSQLFSDTKDFTVVLDKDGQYNSKQFKVVITPTKEEHVINLDTLHRFFKGEPVKVPFRTVMALDIIMKTGLNLKLMPVGRSLFYQPSPDDLHPLGGGREIWFGYYQSVRPTAWKMMVNIDKAVCVFHERQKVLDFISQTLKKNIANTFDQYTIKSVEKELKGLKVRVTHQNIPRKYNVIGLTKKPLSTLVFEMNRNDQTYDMKVVDYFREQYGLELKYKYLPALNVGSKEKAKYLPLEVCEIVEGQPCKKQLDEQQTRNMIFQTCQPPAQRFKEIEQAAENTIKYNKKFMQEFDLKMSTTCVDLPARVLDPPQVMYKNNETKTPKDGVWDMKNVQFYTSIKIQNWILLSTIYRNSCNEKDLQNFKKMLCKIGVSMGIEIEDPKITDIVSVGTIVDKLRKYAKVWKLDLAIIVLPNKNSTIYSDIKNVAETEIGLKTQCVKENTMKKCRDTTIYNILQKINAKMGGINCGLSLYKKPKIFQKPVIIFGADVTHPSPGDKTSYSIAAVVGSLDSHPSRYAAAVRIQQPTKDKRHIEIIVQLKEMVKEILKQFYKNTKQKPIKIIFYRDGVSEGEFSQVQNKEISQIRQSCMELEEDYQPGITYIVVGKRHHTRMMPKNYNDRVGKAGNVPPGTIIDNGITHPTDFDFFLCSHYGIQGTSRPAHYTVLWDDNDFSSDELQKLSYYLCHIYVRCTRSISIPSPVQYAHLAAARAKQHLISKMDVNSSDSSNGDATDSNIDLELLKVVKTFINSMYFV